MSKYDMMKRLRLLGFLGLGALVFNSCATVGGGLNRDLTINTSPQGAAVKIIDARGKVVGQGVTPSTFHLKTSDGFFAKARYRVQLSKRGFEDAEYALVPSFNGNYIWNLFTFSLFGMAVDHMTGAIWRFEGDSYSSDLVPAAGWYNNYPTNTNNNNNNVNTNTNNINVIIKNNNGAADTTRVALPR